MKLKNPTSNLKSLRNVVKAKQNLTLCLEIDVLLNFAKSDIGLRSHPKEGIAGAFVCVPEFMEGR